MYPCLPMNLQALTLDTEVLTGDGANIPFFISLGLILQRPNTCLDFNGTSKLSFVELRPKIAFGCEYLVCKLNVNITD